MTRFTRTLSTAALVAVASFGISFAAPAQATETEVTVSVDAGQLGTDAEVVAQTQEVIGWED